MEPIFRLSLLWTCLLGGMGAFFPFYSLYLSKNAGLSGAQVGAIMSIPPLMGLLMQPVWGWVSDRSGSRVRVLVAIAAGAALGYAGLLGARGFGGFALGSAMLACFAVALLPTAVSVSLALTPTSGPHGVGRVRVWGTIGFGVVVASLPLLLAALQGRPIGAQEPGAEPSLGVMFAISAGLVATGALVAATLPRGGAESVRAHKGELRVLLGDRRLMRLLATLFLAYLFVQGPMALFPILVDDVGGGVAAISIMWIVMLSLEVPLVAWLGASVARVGLRGVIAIGIASCAVRWTLSGWLDDLFWVTVVQVLHGVGVWGLILGGPLYADALVPERLRSSAQGLLAMLAVSLGGFCSNLAAGQLIDAFGPRAPAQVGGVGAALLLLLLPVLLPPLDEHTARDDTAPP